VDWFSSDRKSREGLSSGYLVFSKLVICVA